MSLQVRHKQRLAGGWAYPVGLEALSAALEDVPHASPQPVWFSHSESYRLAKRRQREERDEPLVILEARFSTFGLGLDVVERPMWTVDVRSVPSHLRAWARRGLVAQALPRVRAWLLQPFSETELEGSAGCRVLMREGRKQLVFECWRSRFVAPAAEELAQLPDEV